MPKGRASGSEIDPEILPYLTGAINSSIMMLTIAQVRRRTRRGQAACSGSPEKLHTCLCGVRSSLPNFTQGEEREKKSCAFAALVVLVTLHTACFIPFY